MKNVLISLLGVFAICFALLFAFSYSIFVLANSKVLFNLTFLMLTVGILASIFILRYLRLRKLHKPNPILNSVLKPIFVFLILCVFLLSLLYIVLTIPLL
ncbi:MAG: hypothetical protein ABDH28_04450 [Brevinematia bacterium]